MGNQPIKIQPNNQNNGSPKNTSPKKKNYFCIKDLDGTLLKVYYKSENETIQDLIKYYLLHTSARIQSKDIIAMCEVQTGNRIPKATKLEFYFRYSSLDSFVPFQVIKQKTESEILTLTQSSFYIDIGINEQEQDKIIIAKFGIEEIKIKYSQCYKSTLSQLQKKFLYSRSSGGCLKIGKKLLFPQQKLSNIDSLEQFKQNKEIKCQLIFGYQRILFKQYIMNYQMKESQLQIMQPDTQFRNTMNRIMRRYFQSYSEFRPRRSKLSVQNIAKIIYLYHRNQLKINERMANFQIFKEKDNKAPLSLEIKLAISFQYALEEMNSFYGKAYKGVSYYRFSLYHQEDDFITWKNFTSCSALEAVEKKIASKDGTLYHIQSVTGKRISFLTLYDQDQQIAFLAYTSFIVDTIVKRENFDQVWLIQLPSPTLSFNKIIIWVDDNPQFNQKQIMQIEQDCEVIQIRSTKLMHIWLRQFAWVIQQKGIKLKIISDMVRKQRRNNSEKNNYEAGVDLLDVVFNTYDLCIPILIYCSDEQRALQSIRKKKIKEDKQYKVTKDRLIVLGFAKFIL